MTKRNDTRRLTEVFFSCDIEADGPIPGRYSMSSIGLCVAGTLTSDGWAPADPELHTFYRELKPISEQWDPEAAAVSGLDRDELIRSGADPARAMRELAEWVNQTSREYDGKPVFAAYPLSFDWGFVWWYMGNFEVRNPFGFSNCFDMKTAFSVKNGQSAVRKSTKRYMPKTLLGNRKHTHNALDDAQGQADLLSNLMQWNRPRD